MEDQVAKIQARIDRVGEEYLKAGRTERLPLVLEYMRLKEAMEKKTSGG